MSGVLGTRGQPLYIFPSTEKNFSIRVGKHDLFVLEKTEQSSEISDFIPHPKYDPRTKDNDLMLLRIKNPVKFNDYIRPATLTSMSVQPGTSCIVSGWGLTRSSPTRRDDPRQGIKLGTLGLMEQEEEQRMVGGEGRRAGSVKQSNRWGEKNKIGS